MKNKLNIILNWLIVVYVFLLPWQTVYIFNEKFINGSKSQFLTGQIFATELLLWLIIILYLLVNFRLADLKKKFPLVFNLANKKQFFIFSLWLFLAYSGLSIIWARDQSAAFYLWFHFLEGAALLLIILTSNISKIKLLWALLLSAGLQGILAMQQFLSQSIPADKWLGIAYHSAIIPGDIVIEAGGGRWLRAYGAFSHPNILGGFLLLGLIAACLLWLHYFRSSDRNYKATERLKFSSPEAKKFISLWLKLLAILSVSILIVAGLFFSFSRSAWLALALILSLLFFNVIKFETIAGSWREKIQFLLLPLGIIMLFAAMTFIFNPLVFSRADMANRLEAISQTERISQIGEAWQIIKTAPIFGVGLNNYTVRLDKMQHGKPAYLLQPTHDIYLLIAAELGIIGLIIFIVFVGALFLTARAQSGFLLPIAIISPFLLIGLFDHYLWTSYSGIIIFYLGLTFTIVDVNLQTQTTNEL